MLLLLVVVVVVVITMLCAYVSDGADDVWSLFTCQLASHTLIIETQFCPPVNYIESRTKMFVLKLISPLTIQRNLYNLYKTVNISSQ